MLLRKVDIVDWESDAGRQAIAENGGKYLPCVRVYGKTGTVLGKIMDGDANAIESAIQKELSAP